MKIPKLLTICLVICCLSINVFAACPDEVCGNGVSVSITAKFAQAYPERGIVVGDPASVAQVGDMVEYEVTVGVEADRCPHINIAGDLYLPSYLNPGDEVPLPAIPDCDDCENPTDPQPPCDPITYGGFFYTIQESDLGSLDTTNDKVRAQVIVDADAVTNLDPLILDDGGNDASWSIVVANTPQICIEKSVCPFSKAWDPPETITYNYTLENCGEPLTDPSGAIIVPAPDITVTSILDTQDDGTVEDLIDEFLVANGSDVLAAGASVSFSYDYIVASDETREVITNVVVVNGIGQDAFQTPVTDNDDASVDLLHPEFNIEVTCEDGDVEEGMQRFEVQFCNTGDVCLEILPSIDDINPFYLPDGECSQIFEVWRPLEGGGEGECGLGGGSATLTVDATATLTCPDTFPPGCELDNVVDTDSASATCGIPTCEVEWSVTKECLTSPWNDGDGPCDLQPGDMARYRLVICNDSPICPTDPVELYFLVNDPPALIDELVGPLTAGECSEPIEYEELVDPADYVCTEPGEAFAMEENVATVEVFCADGSSAGPSKEARDTCCYYCPGGEGCTPGFWKNHPACWCDSYTPEMLLSDVFTRLQDPPYDTLDDDDRKSDFDTDTLDDGIRYRGGPGLAGSTRNMLRHAVAALLNGCSDDVLYPISDLMVIDVVNFVLDLESIADIQQLHMILAGFNEDSPCPIDAHCRRHDEITNGNDN